MYDDVDDDGDFYDGGRRVYRHIKRQYFLYTLDHGTKDSVLVLEFDRSAFSDLLAFCYGAKRSESIATASRHAPMLSLELLN